MDKQTKTKADRIKSVEENVPSCVRTLFRAGWFVLIVGAFLGFVVVLMAFGGDYSPIAYGIGIGLIIFSIIFGIILNGISEIVKNTYRSAEYTKLQFMYCNSTPRTDAHTEDGHIEKKSAQSTLTTEHPDNS